MWECCAYGERKRCEVNTMVGWARRGREYRERQEQEELRSRLVIKKAWWKWQEPQEARVGADQGGGLTQGGKPSRGEYTREQMQQPLPSTSSDPESIPVPTTASAVAMLEALPHCEQHPVYDGTCLHCVFHLFNPNDERDK